MGTKEPRLSVQTLVVLDALVSSTAEELSGAQIGRTTGLASGSLYPILLRLEREGWVESRWEEADPRVLGRPRRRFYRVKPLGEQIARRAARKVEPSFRRLAWSG
jgi:PadR family transcriptional regulator PadR